MYTQCPECGTVFRVTARMLRAAQGHVRCGICSLRFNALESLSEQPVPRPAETTTFDDTITVEELPGTEFIELSDGEVREGPTQPPAEAGPGDVEEPRSDDERAGRTAAGTAEPAFPAESEADLPPASGSEDADLEFHGTVDDLERLFVAAEATIVRGSRHARSDGDHRVVEFRRAMDQISSADLSGIEVVEEQGFWPDEAEQESSSPPDPARIAAVLAFPRPGEPDKGEVPPAAAEAPERELTDLDRTDEFPILVLEDDPGLASIDLGDEGPEAQASDRRRSGTGPADDGSAEAARAATSAPERLVGAGAALTAMRASDVVQAIPIPPELRRDAATDDDLFGSPHEFEDEAQPRRWPWALAALLLLVGLGLQAVHHWRGDLARDPLAGPWLLRVYGALGLPLAPPTDLGAFEFRQLGAASDASQAGRLKVRASIVNGAAFAQPFPLLRLSLQDRFGTTIGMRDLEPVEYLPGGELPASGLMAPGQRADAEVVFVDPGRDAVGFQLDVCLREDGVVRCTGDLPAGRS